MKSWKMAVWLMAFCFIFTGLAEAGKEKKKEKKKEKVKVEIKIKAKSEGIKVYDEQHIGRDPFLGNLPDALNLMGYFKKDIDWLNASVMTGEYALDVIRDGEKFLMTSGRNKVGKFIARLEKPLKVKKYLSDSGAAVYFIPDCGNWVRKEEPKPLPTPKPIPVPVIPAPPQPKPERPVPVPEKALPPVAMPQPKPEPVPMPIKMPPPPKKEVCENCIEHEPIVGAYGWENELARGYGFYAEYMLWIRECLSNGSYKGGWSPGVGAYGYYAGGESRKSSYDWIEKGIGPEVGLKYMGETKEGLPYQWQGKLRLVWERQEGGNDEGYHMSQDNLKPGFYTEYIRRLDYPGKWIAGITGEGWISLNSNIHSTWSGDTPQDRAMAAVNVFTQYKLSDDWAVRGSFGGFYQGWDDLFGLRLGAEARYKETLMFGATYAFFPFGLSSIYNGINASQLATWTAFVRLELGKPIREWDAERRRQRVKQTANPLADKKEGLDKK